MGLATVWGCDGPSLPNKSCWLAIVCLLQGECDANPTYMVGDDKQYIGQCNRACEDCHPARERQPEWNGKGHGARGCGLGWQLATTWLLKGPLPAAV